MMKTKTKILLLFPITALIFAVAFYFLYWCKTPAYAVNSVREAVRAHDVAKFEQHVDIKSVLDKGFDDMIIAESKINHDDLLNNPFAMGILHMLKPAVVDLLTQEVRDSISEKKAETQTPKDPVTDAMRKNIKRKLDFDKLKVEDITLDEQKGKDAFLTLTLANDELDKEFELQLKMQQSDSGYWQIKEVTNLVDFALAIDKAQKEKNKAEAKPEQEKLTQSLQCTSQSIKIEEKNGKQVLTAVFICANTSEQDIATLYYDLNIFDHKGNMIYSYPAHIKNALPKGTSQPIIFSKALNPQNPADETIAEADLSEVTWKATPTYVRFADDSILETAM